MTTPSHTVFVDESGNDPNASHYVHAGYLSTAELWESLSTEWSDTLRHWNVGEFHTTEVEALTGEFESWALVKKGRIAHLSGMVDRHTLRGFTCDMKWSDWAPFAARAVAESPQRIQKVMRTPDVASLHVLFRMIAGHCGSVGIAPADVRIVLGAKGKRGERERMAVSRLCEFHGFPRPEYGNPSTFTPLQAADMLAWLIFQKCKRTPRFFGALPTEYAPLVKRVLVDRITARTLREPWFTVKARFIGESDLKGRRPEGVLRMGDLVDFEVDEQDSASA